MTTANNLETLLREWAAIEPDRCRIVTGQNGGYTYEVFRLFTTPSGEDYEFDTSNECFYEIEIQGTVQKAIEARGWKWSVGCTHGHHFSASILSKPIITSWGGTRNKLADDFADTPAEALLSAYIIALESEGKP